MERRLLTFLLASAVFITVYFGLRSMLPPPVQNRVAEDGEVLDPLGEDEDPLEGAEEEVTTGEAEGNVSAIDESPERAAGSRGLWATLGSMNPADGYRMLVTLRSRGAGIERIELTERNEDGRLKYRRVDVRSGYLGYLALGNSPGDVGAIIRVVGPGTPADLARPLDGGPVGLKAGDRIVEAGKRGVTGPLDMSEILEGSEPGETLVITVERPVAPALAESEDAASSEDALPASTSHSFEVELSEHPLDLVRLADTAGNDQIRGNLSRLSCLMTLSQIGQLSIRSGQREIPRVASQHRAVWEMDAGEGSMLEFRLPIGEGALERAGGDAGAVELVRSYRLEPGSYDLDLGMEVINRASSPQKLGYRLEGPNGLTLEGWWYSTKISPNFSGAAARDFVYNTAADHHQLISAYNLLEQAVENPRDPDNVVFSAEGGEDRRQLRYIGVDAQYFVAAYVPEEGAAAITDFSRGAGMVVAVPARIPADQERATNISFYLDSKVETVPAGGSLKHSIRMFAGPKQPDLLDAYALGPTLEYGWFPWVAKPLSWLLHFFYWIVENYVIAIIMLTLLVRGCMFPLSRKAAIHAQKMQELAPELKKIADKYKDDFEKRLKAQRELQQRVGFNPLSGCLPMFVQLPIFIGLYRALSVDIELRQAALAPNLQWCSNLAGPDMLYYWGDWLWEYLSGRGTGWLGPYFNILPLIVVTLFLLQQKMFMPPATDEQTAMTQKVMTFMTLAMGLFFFRVPSGLCIYFITSSLWGICERKLVKKMVPSTPQLALDGGSGGTIDGRVVGGAPGPSAKPSFTDRMRKAAGMEVAQTTPRIPPSKRKRPPGKK